MSSLKKWRFWPPIFYTIAWIAGFLIGIFGILPGAEGPLKIVVASFTTYFIFLINAYIDFRVYLYNNSKYETKPMIDYIVAAIAILCFAAIILSYYYVITENTGLFGAASAVMIGSFFGMEIVKHNPALCFISRVGSDFISNV